MDRVATVGECMIEVSGGAGQVALRFGGDTLNTAVYLARLGVGVDFVTALGDDPFSAEMMAAWRGEGVGTGRVQRVPGRLPGLYVIRTSADGERSFYYWRERAPAREIFDGPEGEARAAALAGYDLVYVSGISLSLYSEEGRGRLVAALARLRQGGGRVAFDTNYRARGWADAGAARAAIDAILAHVDIALPTHDDEAALYGDADARATAARLHARGVREVVVKRDRSGAFVSADAVQAMVAPESITRPVDTTAAGDSFNAAYLAARLAGRSPERAAREGNRLAGAVVRHHGAIIPRDAMPAVGAPANSGEQP